MILSSLGLSLFAFLGAILSGATGVGGGILLLGGMTLFLPASIILPLHSVIQFVSNFSRMLMNRSGVKWRITRQFFLGIFFGALPGFWIVEKLQTQAYPIILGVAILVLTWMPKSNPLSRLLKIPGKFFFLGSINTFASIFVGATGPFVMPFFLREKLSKEELVATEASCQTLTHGIKIFVFSFAGFSYVQNGILLTAALIPTIAGTYVGKKILLKIPEKQFRITLKILLSLLAIRLLFF